MGLRQDMLEDPIAQLDVRELVTIDGKATVRQAVREMRLNRLGCVAVVDDQGRPVGAFTEREVLRLLVKGGSHMDEPVEAHLKRDWACVGRDEPVAKLLEMMRSRGVRFVCVTDEHGRAVGLTGQRGLIEYLVEHFPHQVKTQLMDSKLYMDHREGA